MRPQAKNVRSAAIQVTLHTGFEQYRTLFKQQAIGSQCDFAPQTYSSKEVIPRRLAG